MGDKGQDRRVGEAIRKMGVHQGLIVLRLLFQLVTAERVGDMTIQRYGSPYSPRDWTVGSYCAQNVSGRIRCLEKRSILEPHHFREKRFRLRLTHWGRRVAEVLAEKIFGPHWRFLDAREALYHGLVPVRYGKITVWEPPAEKKLCRLCGADRSHRPKQARFCSDRCCRLFHQRKYSQQRSARRALKRTTVRGKPRYCPAPDHPWNLDFQTIPESAGVLA